MSNGADNSDIAGQPSSDGLPTAVKPSRPATTYQSPLLVPVHAAAYMCCSLRTLWTWEGEGIVASIRRGRWVRFAKEDLDEAIARLRIPARAELPRKRRAQRIVQDGRKA